jgi:hypothetical protein
MATEKPKCKVALRARQNQNRQLATVMADSVKLNA